MKGLQIRKNSIMKGYNKNVKILNNNVKRT